MAKSPTTLKKGDNLPARGRSAKTLILEMMREESLIELSPKSTKEQAEKIFLKHIAVRAFNPEDPTSGMCLSLLTNKGWPNLKPSNETVEFEFDKQALPHIQAGQVMHAAANGFIPPDIANTFIQSIKAMIDIEEYTSLKDRIEKLEELLNK
ncbi:unnamed protein product [marine sediment metagenome]|uniref:Uncharacterized protein n=1 Tax=marine sediment metagenome TaxID=412755 RepID=X0YPJ8_9ZZZZ